MRTTRKLSEQQISNSLKGNRNGNFGGLSLEHRNNIRLGMLNYWKSIDR